MTKELNLKNKNSGITLIALVITIIVMLILVAVTVTMAVNGGLFGKAAEAGRETNEAVALEQALGNGRIKIGGTWYDSPQDYVDNKPSANQKDNPQEGTEQKPKSPYIGYYVYVDGEYGVIYADLAYTKSGEWNGDENSSYSYEAENHEDLKKYFLNGTYDPGDEFGTGWSEKPLLVVDEELNETEGRIIDRFYVMALTNFTTDEYQDFYWDKNRNKTIYGTSTEFEKGADNTELLIEYWEDDDTSWADQDIWNNLYNTAGWFVPSREQWCAFGDEMGIKSSNFSDFGLDSYYLSSSQSGYNNIWGSYPCLGYIDTGDAFVHILGCVRLSTTY